MSKGGGATTTPAVTPTVPQTNALQHLMDMFDQMKPKVDDKAQGPQGPGMPIMNTQAWTQMGGGNFTPAQTSKGGGGSTMGAGSSGKGGGG